MIHGLGIMLAVVLAALALLHVYWAAGGRRGGAAAVPTADGRRLFDPSPLGTYAVAAALLLAALVILGRLGVWAGPFPAWVFYWAAWGISATFLARSIGEFNYLGLFKRVRDTDFARRDTRLFTPLSLFIAAAAGIINCS